MEPFISGFIFLLALLVFIIVSSYMEQEVAENGPQDPEWDILPGGFNATFDCWYRQMGYPIVRITQTDEGFK